MRSVEDSFQRLGLARIDILFVHDIGTYQHGSMHDAHMRTLKDSGYRALDELKRDGVVSAIGIGVNEREVLIEALGFADWDVFLLAGRYTLLEQAPLDDLFPLCAQRGTSIVVGGPLNSGILAGRDTWNYAAAPPAGGRPSDRHSGHMRPVQRASRGSGVAVPARTSTGCSDHPGTTVGFRVHRQSRSIELHDSGRPLGRPAAGTPAARSSADSGLSGKPRRLRRRGSK